MNGLMSRYKASMENMPEPIFLSQSKPLKMDLSGLLRYAKAKGVSPADLSKEEKDKFIKRD